MNEEILIRTLNSKLIFVSRDYDQYYPKCNLIVSFGNGTVAYIWKEDADEWEKGVKKLYESLCKVESNVSFSEFSSYIAHLIFLNKFENFKDITDYFQNMPLKEYHFLKPLVGLKLDDIKQINYDDITLIKKEYFAEYFKNKNEVLELGERILQREESLIYVDVICKAKDGTKASEYAMQKFKIIDICFRFFLKSNNSKAFRFGTHSLNHDSISGMIGYTQTELIATKKEYDYSISIDNYVKTIFETSVAKRIWELMEKADLNDMERRIREAIIWFSMASHENDNSIAFLQCFLAIEAILLVQDEFINKSIVAQISEHAAFILGTDSQERITIEKKFKKLYAIRSAIAHGKKKSNIDSYIKEIFSLTHILIINFLGKDSLKHMQKIDEFSEYMTKLKFS